MTWVFSEARVPGNDRLVLLALANEANDDGLNCFPSLPRLAHHAFVSGRTARRVIVRLEAAGELLVLRPATQGRGHHNNYCVLMGRDPMATAAALGWPTPTLDPSVREGWEVEEEGGQSDPLPGPVDNSQKGDTGGRKGVTSDQKRGAQVSPNPLDPLSRPAELRSVNGLPGPRATPHHVRRLRDSVFGLRDT